MRFLAAAVLLSAALTLRAQAPPVLRPSPKFDVKFPDGNQLPLSSLKGKVVGLLFVHTTCPHCQRTSQVFTKLYQEYKPRGFEAVDVAFNPMANIYVRDFVKDYQIGYPVGFSAPDDVLNYLGFSVMERYVVPQIVWIDRQGNIRSQTPPMGDEKLLQESYWRNMIETLLKEPAEPAKKVPTKTTSSAKRVKATT
jgi:thiol-disulfide isomerase/thioredoxin